MKRMISMLLVMAIIAKANSQTWEEWTQQKKTQIKYLVQQIAGFQTYLGYVKQGYEIAQKGIATVQHIKQGEWNLHKDFFGSLEIINPLIKNSAKVSDIIAMEVGLIKSTNALVRECRQTKEFTFEEMAYLENVCNKLLRESSKNIDELITIITSGELKLKDDERINRIDNIYAEMQEKHVFMRSFGTSVIRLLKNRSHEKNEIELSKTLNNVK